MAAGVEVVLEIPLLLLTNGRPNSYPPPPTLGNSVPTKEDANRVVLRMSRICSSGIDRVAMRFQGLDAILEWLTDGHTSTRSDEIVNLSCLDIGFVSQYPHARIKAVNNSPHFFVLCRFA